MFKVMVLFLLLFTFVYSHGGLFEPLPSKVSPLTDKAKLGKLLFHDPILSRNNTISCASCHPLLNYGVDNLKVSIGIDGRKGKRNAPTVWNARYNFVQFWDGRAKDLEEQALTPITNSFEMDTTVAAVIKKLQKDKAYREHFEKLYEEGVTAKSLADALAAFGKTLITPNSKFDRYLRGDEKALNSQEKEGFRLFKSKGCVSCHNGINVGGTLYQKFGLFESYKSSAQPDYGRFHITNSSEDKYYFKVPSLRNVAKTAPYLHDGSVATLKEAVQTLVKMQLGHGLTENELESIVSFLKALTGAVYE